MTDVVAHLRRCRDSFMLRSARPVVAWDCMGAAAWGRICADIADEIEDLGLTGEQAVGFLKGKAHAARGRADAGDQRGFGIVVTLDAWNRFDEIIDPIARDRTGWIEVTGHREHFGREGSEGMPEYRRMLGVNNCVASLRREWRESAPHRGAAYREHDPLAGKRRVWVEDDAKWEARRLEWLGRYHPQIHVIHREGGWIRDDATLTCRAREYTPLYGTIAEHMSEPFPIALPCAFGTISSPRGPMDELMAQAA